MIRYKLHVKVWPVFVFLDVDHADRYSTVTFEGPAYAVGLAREHLFRAHGVDGHFIEAETTPLDLAVAMRSPMMADFAPELVEGREILKTTRRKGHP